MSASAPDRSSGRAAIEAGGDSASSVGTTSGRPFFEAVGQDIEYAVRSLIATPGFTLVALLCLAIGISANTTMFGVADRLFLRPPPGIRDAGQVVRLYFDREGGSVRTPGGGPASFPDFQDLRGGNGGAFSGVAAFSPARYSYGTGSAARELFAENVSASYFDVLRTRPAIGRFFRSDEDSVAASHPVVVVSYGFWEREFGGDPNVLGKVVTLDGRQFTIVGVTERGFSGFNLQPLDVWVPIHEMTLDLGPDMLTERHAIWVNLIARLAPGVSRSEAMSRASGAKQAIDPIAARDLDPHVRVVTGPLLEADGPMRRPQDTIALWLSAAVVLVLLIACANVANLLLARGARRRREIAIRLSLGAGRGQLVRQLFVESLVLALIGGALGLLLSLWSSRAVGLLDLPASASVLDARALMFTAAVSVVTAIVFGLAPALINTRLELASSLKESPLRSGGGRPRLQTSLLVVQAALSMVVLAGAGLFVRSLRNIRAVDLGMDADHIVVASVSVPNSGYDSLALASLYDRAVERLSTIPGVVGVSYEAMSPFRGILAIPVRLPGQDSTTGDRRTPSVNFVGPDFLRANGTALRSGRDISIQDRAGTMPVAVVNETMAKRFWPGQNPLGQCMKIALGRRPVSSVPCTYVVGVMADGKYVRISEDQLSFYVLPNSQQKLPVGPHQMGPPPTLVIRGTGDPHRLVPQVRQAMQAVAPDLPAVDVHAIADVIDPEIQPYRIGAVLFTAFGLVALFLAAIGLYGVVSYVVAQRTREVGVRLALGARGSDVRALILRQGMAPALLGTALGLLGAAYVTRFFRSQLYGVSPIDPATLVTAALGLCAVAVLACYLPARRAAGVDPVIAMRAE
jgi:putative ABC transport system permease protein